MNDLIPADGHPSCLQLYFYDTDHEVENRMQGSQKINSGIVQILMNSLSINPYCSFFRSPQHVPTLESLQIVIKCNVGLDQRVYNSPSESQVAEIWIESDDSSITAERHIIVQSHTGHSDKVHYYFGCYDPLQYPLLFPYSDTGWHQGIQRLNSTIATTYYQGQISLNASQIQSIDELLEKEEKGIGDIIYSNNTMSIKC